MIIFSLLVANSLQAQKLYVYRQELKAGTIKSFVDEKGNETHSKASDFIYLVYLQTTRSPVVKELWIDGNQFEFKIDSISTPVVLKTGVKFNHQQKTDTLVKKTSEKVYRIIPGKKISDSTGKNSRGVILVIKGKKLKQPKIKDLPPVYNQ